MLSAVSDDRPQWKIDEIILDALEGLDLSDEKAKAEFERIRILDEKQIEEELARLEAAEEDDEFAPLVYIASNPDLIAAFGSGQKRPRASLGGDRPGRGATDRRVRPPRVRRLEPGPDRRLRRGGGPRRGRDHPLHRAGFAEGRPIDEFAPLEYVASNPDLIAAFGGAEDPEEAATIHYIEPASPRGDRSTSSPPSSTSPRTRT